MKIRSISKWVIVAFGLAGAGLLAAGCNPLKCGDGTREADGKCVPLNQVVGDDAGIHCGGNTVMIGNECIPVEEICGPFTTVEYVEDASGMPTNAFVCVGQSTTDEPPPECPDDLGPGGEICINGWVRWFMDDQGRMMETILKDPDATGADATILQISAYDPLAYAADPSTAPIATGEVNPVTGTFRIEGVSIPGPGFIALVVDENGDQAEDNFAFTGIPFDVSSPQNLLLVTAPAITLDQVDEWTNEMGGATALEAMGCPAPAGGGARSLLTCGTWVALYAYGNQDTPEGPMEGVVPHLAGSPLPPAKTFYMGYSAADGVVFDETAAGVVWSDGDGPYEHTGHLGTVFFPTASLGTTYTGSCAPDTPCSAGSCAFGPLTGGAARNAMFVQYLFPLACPNL